MVLAEYFSTIFTREPEGEVPLAYIKDVPRLTNIYFTFEEIKRVIDN